MDYNVYQATDFYLQDIFQTSGQRCLFFASLEDCNIYGNGNAITYLGSFPVADYAMVIEYAANVTIQNIKTSKMSGIQITSGSGTISITDSVFMDVGSSGIEVDTPTSAGTYQIRNNTFYDCTAGCILGEAKNISVIRNKFFSPQEFAVRFQNVDYGVVSANEVYDMQTYAFNFANATNLTVSNNMISGGFFSSVFVFFDNSGIAGIRQFLNNRVANITGAAQMQTVFQASTVFPSSVLFEGNLIENIKINCSVFSGFLLYGGVFSLEGNIVVGVYQYGPVCTNLEAAGAPFVAPYRIQGSVVTFLRNSASSIDGLDASFVRPAGPTYDLVAVYVLTSNITISDCVFSNFLGASYTKCSINQCDPTYASMTAGLFVDSSSPYSTAISNVTMTNSMFSNFKGGNGGDIIQQQADFVADEMRGGDVVGIYSGQNAKIEVSDTSFLNFVGGQGGTYWNASGPASCTNGVAVLEQGPGPTPLFKNVTGLNSIRTCQIEIYQCGSYTNLSNAVMVISSSWNPQPNSTNPCLTFVHCSNIVLSADSSHFEKRSTSFQKRSTGFPPSSPIAISVSFSSNFTITNLDFYGGFSVRVEHSSAVTISNCFFATDFAVSVPASGLYAETVDMLTVVNNTFSFNAGISGSGNMTNVFVINNLFSDSFFTVGMNSSVALEAAGNFTVTHNQFVGTMSTYAIFVNTSSFAPNLVGIVSDNTISGGTVSFAIMLTSTFHTIVSRNLVSGVTSNCFSFFGILVSGSLLLPTTVQISDNVVRDFYSSCPVIVGGITVEAAIITEMNNNTISNFSIILPATVMKTSVYYILLLASTSGVITNTTIRDIHAGSPAAAKYRVTLVGTYVAASTSQFDGLFIQNLSVNKTLNCVGCNSTGGTPVYGLYSYYSNITAQNIFMSDFKAGDAGVASDPPTENYAAPGGDAIGLLVVESYSFFLNNATFQNFKAGNAGYSAVATTLNYTQCNGGTAAYFHDDVQYYGTDSNYLNPNLHQIEVANMVNGLGCLDSFVIEPPVNASMTYTRSSFTITWFAPNTPRAPIYTVEIQSPLNYSWTTVYSKSDLSYTASKLLTSTVYHARLATVVGSAQSLYVYFVITTLPASVPITSVVNYKEFSVDSITLTWEVIDTGGLSINGFTVEMWNASIGRFIAIYQGSLTLYKKTGLHDNTSYTFHVRAVNDFGQGPFSENVTYSTAARACGDGNCDNGENCSTCYLDCGSCGYQPCPGTPECNSGKCVNGVCECLSGWSGPACEFSSTPIVVAVNDTSPTSTITVGGGGDGKTPGNAQFTVAFRDIQEINAYGDTIKSFDLSQQKYIAVGGSSSSSFNETSYNTSLPNNAVLLIHLYVVLQDSVFSFANQSIHVPANSVKYSMEIWNWPFLAYNNKLKVTMESKGGSQQPKDDCVGVTPQTDDSDNLLWIKVTVNGAVLYGKFSNIAEIDDVSKVVQFSYNYTSALIETIIPFFWNQAVFDPNFQVLLDPTSNNKCSSDLKNKKSSFTDGKIAGIVVAVVFGIAIIVAIVGYIIIRRRRSIALQLLRSSSDIPLEEQPMKESKQKKNKNKEQQEQKREGEQASIIEKRPDMEAHTAAGTFKVDF